MANTHTPKLRFPEFSEGWIYSSWGALYRFVPTNSLSRENLNYENGSVKNIHYGDIHTQYNARFFSQKEAVPYINADISSAKFHRCEQGDIIIADASEDYNDIGKSIEIIDTNNEEIVAGLHTLHAKPKTKKIALGYSAYLMASPALRKGIKLNAQGTKVLGITAGRINSLNFAIPSIPEQRKIAGFLASVDAKISQLQKKKRLLTRYKHGCMQRLFSQEFRFTSENGKEFPQWKMGTLGNVAKVYDGTHQTPKYVEKGVPFYSVEQVTSNNFSDTKYVTIEAYNKEHESVLIEKNDILMTRIGDIGTCRIVDWDVQAAFYVSLALLKVKKSAYPAFVNQYIKSDFFQRELWMRTIHAAFPKKINLGEIEHCRFSIPHLDEQRKIADFLSAIDRKIELVATELEKARTFKKGLLQQMFV